MYVCVWLEELDKNPLVIWRDLKEALLAEIYEI